MKRKIHNLTHRVHLVLSQTMIATDDGVECEYKGEKFSAPSLSALAPKMKRVISKWLHANDPQFM